MKKFINDPAQVVDDAMLGIEAVHGSLLKVHRAPNFVRRVDSPIAGKVTLISGGGGGHEPMHAGFVGKGMLDVAVLGAIFTSASSYQIYEAAKSVATEAGVIFIVKNFTGDRLNFKMASDLLKADGIPLEIVLVNDDVAIEDDAQTEGRRATGGTIMVEKIAGAAAEAGMSLPEVAAIARRVNEQVGSMGLALTSCVVPQVGRPTFELGDNEVEVGVGIHGERGCYQIPLKPAKDLLAELANPIVADLNLNQGDRVIAMVNGLGGTPLIELYVMAGELATYCQTRDITVERWLVGSYVTALDMAGCIITLLKVDDELLKFWDAPVSTSTLSWS
jgi:phosphoenolpyruvate---glycerone phosphotransferase subunit DhaK